MHIPSDLLGHPIGQMANNQAIQTTTFTEAIQPTSPTLQMGSSSIPFIGRQSSMGGQILAGGKPSAGGNFFVEGKPSAMGKIPMWGKHQQTLEQVAPTSPSISTTICLYPNQPYLGVSNPLWGQPNPTGIPQQGTFPNKYTNLIISTQHSPQTKYMGGSLGQP